MPPKMIRHDPKPFGDACVTSPMVSDNAFRAMVVRMPSMPTPLPDGIYAYMTKDAIAPPEGLKYHADYPGYRITIYDCIDGVLQPKSCETYLRILIASALHHLRLVNEWVYVKDVETVWVCPPMSA